MRIRSMKTLLRQNVEGEKKASSKFPRRYSLRCRSVGIAIRSPILFLLLLRSDLRRACVVSRVLCIEHGRKSVASFLIEGKMNITQPLCLPCSWLCFISSSPTLYGKRQPARKRGIESMGRFLKTARRFIHFFVGGGGDPAMADG